MEVRIAGFATMEGTDGFAKRADSRQDFYTMANDLIFSSLGLGTFRKEPYREENYMKSYEESVIEGIKNGCNVIDTAINYRYQESEKEVGRALKKLFSAGHAKRDELIVCSKAGFIPLEFPFPSNPYAWIEKEMLANELATKEEIIIDQHCLSIPFLEWSLERSLENLGLETLDIFYVHNPETQLGYISKEALHVKMEKVFEWLEEKVDEGKIKAFGIATWNGFIYEQEHTEYLSLLELVGLANKVRGKDHHFDYIQLPYNLGKTQAYSFSSQALEDGTFYSAIGAAKKLGLHVITSSSLLQMNLFQKEFSEHMMLLLGKELDSNVKRGLQFVRSASGVTCSLFGAIDPNHVKHNLELSKVGRISSKIYQLIYGLSA